MSEDKQIIPLKDIQTCIFTIRNNQVMIDRDLAELYGVETKNLNLAVKRNIERFPNSFRFQLTEEEYKNLRLQTETSNKHGGRRYLPQEIFFNGQVFDAYTFVSDIIKTAKKSIILIDNYIDDTVLTHFTKRKKRVTFTIYTKNISKQLQLDIKKHNAQYPAVKLIKFEDTHDRFLIIDDKEIYHFGASLKDLGKKWFAVSKMDISSVKVLDRVKQLTMDNER